MDDELTLVYVFPNVVERYQFCLPKRRSASSKPLPKLMFFGIGYNILILGCLGVFWRRIWNAFGMHDGSAGHPNLVILSLGHCSRALCLLGGLQGCFCMIFGTTFGCIGLFFKLP